jgi:streptomycin 6-kinase
VGSDVKPLAEIAREVATLWSLDPGARYPGSNYSYVAPVSRDAVLKVRPPDDDESDQEADALTLWGGDGAVRLIRSSPAHRATLIERATPGTDISNLPEVEATAIAVDIATRLWRPAGDPFRSIGDHVPRWLEHADASAEPGRELIPLARELYGSLQPGRSVLVHGDFHHHNILDAGDRYLAIDPKPMLGEPEYDVASFLRNPIGYELELDATLKRLKAFARAGLDEWRMRAWSVIRCAYLGADESEVRVLRALVE